MKITEKLFELQDEKYGDFQCKLTPGIDRDRIESSHSQEIS